MRKRPYIELLKLVCLSLFVWSQAATLSHAAVHGDAPHEHDGVICDASILVSEDQAVLPADAPAPYILAACATHPEAVVSNTIWIWPPERGPPPRSPPVTQ